MTKLNRQEKMKKLSLKNKIYSIKGDFLHYVDYITINYMKTQYNKNNPAIRNGIDRYTEDQYTPIDLSKKEKESSIEYLEWFIKDIESCITHLKNK